MQGGEGGGGGRGRGVNWWPSMLRERVVVILNLLRVWILLNDQYSV